MIRFNDFVYLYKEKTDSQILNEKRSDYGVSQTEANKIKKKVGRILEKCLLLKEGTYDFIGSAGFKKQDSCSYNLDIIINQPQLMEFNNLDNEELILGFIKDQLKRVKIVSDVSIENNNLKFEWQGNDGKIEVLLKPTNSYECAQYFRTNYESENDYTNKYRELFFEAIAMCKPKKIKEYFKNDTPKVYKTYNFDAEKGLFEMERSFVGRHGVLKTSKKIPNSKRLISSEPCKIVEDLLGSKRCNLNKYRTFKQVFEAFESDKFPYPTKRRTIFKTFKKLLEKNNLSFDEKLNEYNDKLNKNYKSV